MGGALKKSGGCERVLVVGGGIAGLALAACLQRQGRSVEVVERAEAWRPLGAGIVLQWNAMAVLRLLGLEESIRARGVRLVDGALADQRGGVLGKLTLEKVNERYGVPYGIHRAALHDVLLEACEGVLIRMGETVEAFTQKGEEVDVVFASGDRGTYDLVVGADGLHSKVRSLLWPQTAMSPQYAGYVCWRFVCENRVGRREMTEMLGRGRRFGIVPLGDNKLYVFATLSGASDLDEGKAGTMDFLRDVYRGFGGDVPAILGGLDESVAILRHPIADLPRPCWHDGRVVLIGDAAHGMTPNMGQGAAQALEDVGMLSSLLHQGGEVDTILSDYRKVREARVTKIMRLSRRFGWVNQWSSPWAVALRNLLLRMTPASVIEKQSVGLIADFPLLQKPVPLF